MRWGSGFDSAPDSWSCRRRWRWSSRPWVNSFISAFKDTSLVVIIGLFDLLGAVTAAVNDANWRGTSVEAYIFAAAIYFCFCFFMSRYSQMLEREFNKGRRR